jgi:DNA-binding Lrp family transcriptional regulator
LFPDEASMIGPLCAAALDGWASNSVPWVVVREHKVDTRIPDLVLARLDEDAVNDRASVGAARPLTRPEIVVLTALRRDCGSTVATTARRAAVADATVRRTLRHLEADGFVERSSAGSWHPTFLFRPLVTRFVSFEAKRNDWRGALSQARAHRLFANEAYVAFDPAFARRFERSLPYYRTSGIGLLALGPEPRAVRRLLRGKSGRPLDLTSAAVAGEEVWSRLLGVAARQLPQTRLPNASAQIVDREPPQLVGGRSKRLERLLRDLAQPVPA